MDFFILLAVTGISLLISFLFNREKTVKALKMATKRFRQLAVPLLLMVLFMSVVLALIPPELISENLAEKNSGIAALTA